MKGISYWVLATRFPGTELWGFQKQEYEKLEEAHRAAETMSIGSTFEWGVIEITPKLVGFFSVGWQGKPEK